MKTIKTYEDGSELTVTGLAGAVVVGMGIAAALTYAHTRYDRWTLKRYMKTHGWPKEAVDRI
jgi:hypothetical protein